MERKPISDYLGVLEKASQAFIDSCTGKILPELLEQERQIAEGNCNYYGVTDGFLLENAKKSYRERLTELINEGLGSDNPVHRKAAIDALLKISEGT